jgi:hypothetical protein
MTGARTQAIPAIGFERPSGAWHTPCEPLVSDSTRILQEEP